MQLQQMAGKLGIVHRKDLAQTTAHHLPKWLRYTLWIVIELALMATDLAEVIGSGIALHLLFWLALAFSILITIFDVSPLIGAHASRISKDRGHRINLDPHDPCNFSAIWFSYRNQISGNLLLDSCLKKKYWELVFQKEMKP